MCVVQIAIMRVRLGAQDKNVDTTGFPYYHGFAFYSYYITHAFRPTKEDVSNMWKLFSN